MALGTTNIDTTLVKGAIGSTSDNVYTLCTSTLINKWSKYKPVRGTWPQATDGKYGFNLANIWAYLRPRGNYTLYPTEPLRLEDFRGYEHNQANTLPPAYVKFTGTNFAQNLHNDALFYKYVSGQLMLNDNGSIGASEISLTDLGLENYYFGMGIIQSAHGLHFYKTLQDYAVNSNAQTISVNPFTQLPTQLFEDGTLKQVVFFLSSTKTTTDWQTTPPSNIIYLPHETVDGFSVISSWTLIFDAWMLAEGVNPYTYPTFPATGYTTRGAAISTNVNSTNFPLGWTIKSKPDWINASVYDIDNNRAAWSPFYGTDEDGFTNHLRLDVIPNSSTSTSRSGSIVVAIKGEDYYDPKIPAIIPTYGAELISMRVYQSAPPPSGGSTVFLHNAVTDPTYELTTLDIEYNSTLAELYISYSIGGLPNGAKSLPCYITVSKRVTGQPNTLVYFNSSGTPYVTADTYYQNRIYSVYLQAGYIYDVYVSDEDSPQIFI